MSNKVPFTQKVAFVFWMLMSSLYAKMSFFVGILGIVFGWVTGNWILGGSGIAMIGLGVYFGLWGDV